MANRSTTDAVSALQGKVAGVQVISTSSAPGAPSTLRVRGFSSNGNSDPLFIVDGLKVDNIDYLDPESIESMEVLKDAASAAIYGAEAGNGVVLISTKIGKKSDGRFFYNNKFSLVQASNKADLLNANEYIQFIKEAGYSEQLINDYYYNNPSSYVNNKLADTDWQDEVLETGFNQVHTVGVEGGKR
ncbi:TonB-dependent receptor plug domain-containing protein [uncultured Draconibacterium sp.]|uniref:TonB-dependent receptor plug domain-containing protein n=1 Tax=uncultured Draconibacterium sp. TaxID=1573823 RepID=UPI0032166EA2